MTSLNSLPDLCLLKIMDRIPVSDMLKTVTLVNRRWNSFTPAACARRAHCPLILVKSKRIFKMASDVDDLKNDLANKEEEDGTGKRDLSRNEFEFRNYAIECGKISSEACELLAKLLPNLKSFHFIQLDAQMSQIEKLNLMLSNWKSSLVNLKIWFWSLEEDRESRPTDFDLLLMKLGKDQYDSAHRIQLESLFDSINSLASLKRLELNFHFGSPQKKEIFVQLPVVRQLEQLKYSGCRFYEKSNASSNGFVVLPFESLKNHGEPTKTLKKISVNNLPYIEDMEQYNRFSDEFTNRFVDVHFTWAIDEENIEEYANFFRKCSSLKRVRLNILKVSIVKIADFLDHLPYLRKLRLNVDTTIYGGPQDDPEYFDYGRVEENEHLPVLSSVKELCIHGNFGARSHLEHLHLHRVFTSVKVILLNFRADICKKCKKAKSTKPKRKTNKRAKKSSVPPLECIQKTLVHLKLCEKLKKVSLSFSEFEDQEALCFTPQELFDEYRV